MTSSRNVHPTVSEEQARRILARAAELEDAGSGVPVARLRDIAIEAGLSEDAFNAAMDEVRIAPRVSPPMWVRVCLWSVPDRSAALVYYWFFAAGIVALPIASLVTTAVGRFTGLAGMAFCTFALWSTSRAINWADRNGWPAPGQGQSGSDDASRRFP